MFVPTTDRNNGATDDQPEHDFTGERSQGDDPDRVG